MSETAYVMRVRRYLRGYGAALIAVTTPSGAPQRLETGLGKLADFYVLIVSRPFRSLLVTSRV